jgi:anti-sigma regulatory factor (Ser/Thr protein kinase)
MERAVDEIGEVTLHLPCEARSVRAARRALASLLRARGWHEVDIERAQLAMSELVANAVVHARSSLTVRVRVDGWVRLAVSDGDPRPVLVPRTVPADRVGGRGLRLVADLSRRWGVERDPRGKTVWCELEPRGPLPGTRADGGLATDA